MNSMIYIILFIRLHYSFVQNLNSKDWSREKKWDNHFPSILPRLEAAFIFYSPYFRYKTLYSWQCSLRATEIIIINTPDSSETYCYAEKKDLHEIRNCEKHKVALKISLIRNF